MMNFIAIMGRLYGAPTICMPQSGLPAANFRVAVDRDYAAQGSERQTDFIDCVAWRHTAEFLGKYFAKGDKPHMIQRFYNSLGEPRSEKPAPSAKSIKCVHGVLHKALAQAVKLGYLRSNPSDVCELPRIVRKQMALLR